jgi:CTP:molybdopterin cytidylyltransferase MocA
MKLPCVLLAAGDSTRMGRNKLLVSLGGEPLVRRTARNALETCSPLVVVTGSQAELIEAALADLGDIVFVRNPDWRLGMASSAIAGLAQIERITAEAAADMKTRGNIPGFFLHHADMPFVPTRVYEILAAEVWKSVGDNRSTALVSACRGIPGHPVYFPLSCMQRIKGVGKGESLKSALVDCGFSLVETGSESIRDDCDTLEDLERLAERYGLELSLANRPQPHGNQRSET